MPTGHFGGLRQRDSPDHEHLPTASARQMAVKTEVGRILGPWVRIPPRTPEHIIRQFPAASNPIKSADKPRTGIASCSVRAHPDLRVSGHYPRDRISGNRVSVKVTDISSFLRALSFSGIPFLPPASRAKITRCKHETIKLIYISNFNITVRSIVT